MVWTVEDEGEVMRLSYMKKKLLVILSLAIVFLTIAYYLMFYVLSGVGTSFARTCEQIYAGMSKEQVLTTMNEFENKQKVIFSEKENALSYITPGLSGDYQCHVYLDEQDKVVSVIRIFD